MCLEVRVTLGLGQSAKVQKFSCSMWLRRKGIFFGDKVDGVPSEVEMEKGLVGRATLSAKMQIRS